MERTLELPLDWDGAPISVGEAMVVQLAGGESPIWGSEPRTVRELSLHWGGGLPYWTVRLSGLNPMYPEDMRHAEEE